MLSRTVPVSPFPNCGGWIVGESREVLCSRYSFSTKAFISYSFIIIFKIYGLIFVRNYRKVANVEEREEE